jgi:putative DNA primase/helicase
LVHRIEANGLTKPTFHVVTRIEVRDDAMALPGGAYPKTDKFEVALIDVPLDIQRKYRTRGTLKSWRDLARLASRNSRMMLAFSLPFVGPMSDVASVEHVGVQLVEEEGGSGKSAIGVAASSAWGWDPDPVQADRNGFGSSWNSTVNNLERVFSGYNQTLLFLNETRVAGKNAKQVAESILEAIMKIEGSVGKGRLNEAETRRWFVPLLSTSNISVRDLAEQAGHPSDSAFLDRLADIPVPAGGHGMFETLHGFADVAALSVELKRLAAENHGWAGRKFVKMLLQAKKKNVSGLKQFIRERRAGFTRTAKRKIVSSTRDLTRLHGKFATIYAAGALAIEYEILPFKPTALLSAILKCEADHVACVKRADAGDGNTRTSGLESLRRFLRARRNAFADLSDLDDDVRSASGYLNRHNGHIEFLVENDRFVDVVGGKQEADLIKTSLAQRGLLQTERGNHGKERYVVRRKIGTRRRWVVAIDARVLDE